MRDARKSLTGSLIDEKETLFAAAVLGFYFLLRVSEIAQVKRSDITIENTGKGRGIILAIRRSKTDQAGQGVARALLETKTDVCPVAIMEDFLLKRKNKGDQPILGNDLRIRLESGLKSAASANGVSPDVIGAHSLRAGGATSLYIQGVAVLLIQRFGRWKSASFLRYLRYDSIALGPLSGALWRESGMLNQLRLTRSNTQTTGGLFRAGGKGLQSTTQSAGIEDFSKWAEITCEMDQEAQSWISISSSSNKQSR